MINFIELMQLTFLAACVGWAYTEKLTQPRQLFDFVQGYYHLLPNKVSHALTCPYCMSGWFSIIFMFIKVQYVTNLFTLLVFCCILVVTPCVAMFWTGVVLKVNDFYSYEQLKDEGYN